MKMEGIRHIAHRAYGLHPRPYGERVRVRAPPWVTSGENNRQDTRSLAGGLRTILPAIASMRPSGNAVDHLALLSVALASRARAIALCFTFIEGAELQTRRSLEPDALQARLGPLLSFADVTRDLFVRLVAGVLHDAIGRHVGRAGRRGVARPH